VASKELSLFLPRQVHCGKKIYNWFFSLSLTMCQSCGHTCGQPPRVPSPEFQPNLRAPSTQVFTTMSISLSLSTKCIEYPIHHDYMCCCHMTSSHSLSLSYSLSHSSSTSSTSTSARGFITSSCTPAVLALVLACAPLDAPPLPIGGIPLLASCSLP
jgi:hypothetical protein